MTVVEMGQVEEDVQLLARELLPRLGELADGVTASVLEVLPEVAPNGTDEELAVVRESTEQNVGAALSTLAFGVVPGAAEPPVGTIKVFHQTVAGGGDLVTMLRAFRLGHAAVSRLWIRHVGERLDDPVRRHAVIAHTTDQLFRYFDGACEQLADRYRREFPEGGSRGRDSRRQVLDGLLARDVTDPDAAGATLGYDLRLHHLGVVIAKLGEGGSRRRALERLSATAGTSAQLVQAAAGGVVWAWLGAREALAPGTLDALAALDLPGVLVGIGDPQHGLEGFRLTHEQALDAERLGRVAPEGGAVLLHRRVELAGLLCGDPVRARRLAEDRLGALGRREAGAERLRETLRAYLRCGRSKARTAEALHIHQKTVAYRLARAEELLGAPLPADCSELEAALLIDLTLHGA